MNEPLPVRVVFAGLARDVAAFLPRHFETLSAIGAGLSDWGYCFLENDSRDATAALLDQFGARHRRGLIGHEPSLLKQHPRRTARLAALRNTIIERVLAEPRLAGMDFLLLMDLDAVNSDLDPEEILRRIAEPERDWAALFANQQPFYYDIWALRHPTWSPDDCWERVRKRPFWMSKARAKAQFINARAIALDPAGPRIEVESAFGGLGLYDMRFIRAVGAGAYRGLDARGAEICEHVAFHAAIRAAGGRLMIDPALINLRSRMVG